MNVSRETPRKTIKTRGHTYVLMDSSEDAREGDIVTHIEQSSSRHKRTHFVSQGSVDGNPVTIKLHPHEKDGGTIPLKDVLEVYRREDAEFLPVQGDEGG